MKPLFPLFFTFFKIGAFTFGGGYAMIPAITRETVERHGWITQEDLLDIVAVAESTPGPIAINVATFVGWRTAGFCGAVLATLGVVLPSFVIISILTGILNAFQNAPAVQYAFRGIQAGVLALIFKALISMYKQCPKGLLAYGIMAGALMAVAIFQVPALPVIAGCALAGLVATFITRRKV